MYKRHSKKVQKIFSYLESCSENLTELLESYRYLQPKGDFSVKTIEKIFQLYTLGKKMAKHRNELIYHQGMLKCLKHEKICIEKGINNRVQKRILF